MIVVVGVPGWVDSADAQAGGLAAFVALEAAGLGARVELVGRVGDDDPGDRVLLALSRAGVGHVAVLRDPARATAVVTDRGDDDDPDADPTADSAGEPRPTAALDAEDLGLALRYLTAFEVVVVADPLAPDALAVVAEAAGFASAHLIVLAPAGIELPTLPAATTVLETPDDPDLAFARLVARYATGLDSGARPADAFRAALAGAGAEAATVEDSS